MKNVQVPTIKSLYIEMLYDEQVISSGTAILVAISNDTPCVLVTNRHNVTGRDQNTNKCLSKKAACPNYINIHFHVTLDKIGEEWKIVKLPLYKDDGEPWWIEHPTLKSKADIVALNFSWGDDVVKYPYFLDTDKDNKNMYLFPSDTVSVIGYPFGLSSTPEGKLPLWASGFIAQDMSLISNDDPTFIIDCRTRQGQSGSAVIAFRPSSYNTVKDGRLSLSLTPSVSWDFLGVYSGRINSESDLGLVWHRSAIRQLVEAAGDIKLKNKPLPEED